MRRSPLLILCALALAACGGRAAVPADRGTEAAPDSAPDARAGCSTNAGCVAKDYCQLDDGCAVIGGKLGQCRERPTECAAYLSPVCGCDGQDYPNPCGAHRLGLNIAAAGPCTD